MKNKKIAFTLAEVLIVLTIIGIVASLTIPALIEKTQNQQYVTALRKFFSEANQALALTAIEEGTPGKLGAETPNALTNDIVRHFKKSKDCGTFTNGNCWAKFNEKYNGTGNEQDPNTWGASNFITIDGMSVVLYTNSPDCSDNSYNDDANSPMHNYCGEMFVDVNGPKGPNKLGRDVFDLYITSNKAPFVYPNGSKDYYYWKTYHMCQPSNPDGYTCAGRILDEGGQMNY